MDNEFYHKENQGEISVDILSALQILKQTKCQLLKTGSKPVRDIYFICQCDPDQKEPICRDCIDNCHKGHQIINSFETQAVCNCGLKMHEKQNSNVDKNEVNEKCLFSDWAKTSKANLIYKDRNTGYNYCSFCVHFCGKNFTNKDNNLEEIEQEAFSNNIINNNENENNNNSLNFDEVGANDMNNNNNLICECTHDNHKSTGKIVKNFFELFYYKSDLNELKRYNFEPTKRNYLIEDSDKNSNSILNVKSEVNTIMNVNAKENSAELQNVLLNPKHNINENIKNSNLTKNKNLTFLNNNNGISYSNNTINQNKINPEKIMEKLIIKFPLFTGLNQTQLINLILNSKRTYTNYFGLFEKYLKFIKDEIECENFEMDSQMGFTNFSLCLGALRNMAETIKMTNYSFYHIEELLSERFIFILISRKFDYKNLSVWSAKNNMVYLYYKFVFRKDFAKLPKISIPELYNLDPLQHSLLISNAYTRDFSYLSQQYFKNSSFLNTCIKKISKLSDIKENNIHKCELIRTVYRILCQLAKWKAFSQENVVNFCNASDDLIFRFHEYNRENGLYMPEVENAEFPHGTTYFSNKLKKNMLVSQLKILIKIIKTHIYLIFNHNNDVIFSLLKQSNSILLEELDRKTFFISDPEIGRSINKTIITIMNFSRNLKKFKLKEMQKLLNYVNRIQTLAFEYPDNYVLSLRRILDKNKEIYVDLIEADIGSGLIGKLVFEEVDFLKLILIETEQLDTIYHRFSTFEDSYEEFLVYFHEKLKEFLLRYGIFKAELPENDFDFDNFEFEKSEKREFKDLNYFEERNETRKKIKVFERPIRLFEDFEHLIHHNDNASKHDKNANSLKLMLKFKILINKSFYINTVLNGLKIIVQTELNKTRSLNVLVNPNVIVAVLRLLYFYIEENVDNCFAILNTNLFGLIKFLDLSQADLLINYLTFILVNLRNNNADFASSKEIIKICKIIHHKLLMHPDKLNLMLKFINILKLVSDFPFLNQAYVYDRIRRILKEFYSGNKVLMQFKSHLLNLTRPLLAEFSNRNTKEDLLSHERRSILNSVIINNNNNFLGGNLQGTIINSNTNNKNNNVNNNYSSIEKSNTINNTNYLGSNFNANTINNNLNNGDGAAAENINLTDKSDFQQTLIIYTLFLKLVNFIFDGNATLNEENYLSSILNQPEIQQILGKKDLNIKLRLEILKFFRMIYIDIIIDTQKLNVYRSVIVNQISSLSENNDDSLEDSLRYDFFNSLIAINSFNENIINKNNNNNNNNHKNPSSNNNNNNYNVYINTNIPNNIQKTKNSKNGKNSNLSFESYIIKFELKHFSEIMNSFSSRKKNNQALLEYFENGILMPLYVFLNKFMSIIYDLKGSEYINLYEIVIYFLRVKKLLVEHYVDAEKDAKVKGKFFKKIILHFKNEHSLFKDVNREETIYQINYDLEILKKKDFEIFNHKLVYEIFQKHFDEFIISNQSKSILDFFKKKEAIYSESKIDKMSKRLRRLDMLDNNFELNVFNLILKYENDKNNFQSSAFLSCLDEHNLEYNSNYRFLLIRSIFHFVQEDAYCSIYKKKMLVILLKLLQYQTVPIQKEIFLIYDHSQDAINLNFIVDLFFENLISVIFSSCNPSSVNSDEDYFFSLLIIKILKYLCEEHYQDFQKVLFEKLKFEYFAKAELSKLNAFIVEASGELSSEINNKIKYDKEINFNNSNLSEENIMNVNSERHYNHINNKNIIKNKNKILNKIENENAAVNTEPREPLTSKNITFFELMLCILSKILVLSKWNKIDIAKSSMKSASKQSDFFSDIFFGIIELLIEMIQGTSAENLENIKLESRGDSNYFYNFLCISKNILYHEDHNSSIVNNSRKNIIEFLIAFLEEKSTPKKLVQLIASVINPYSVFEAIIKIMKKNFVMTHEKYKGKEEAYIHFYNMLFFDKGMKEYFINIYFNDTEFCSRDEFELANRMFQYVKLLADKFQHEEAINLINSVANESALEKKVKSKLDILHKQLKLLDSRGGQVRARTANINQLDAISKTSFNKQANINNIKNINKINITNHNNNNLIQQSQQNLASSSPNNNNNPNNPSLPNPSENNFTQSGELIAEFLRQDEYFRMFSLDRTNETSDYEIINIIGFFERITRKIIVQNGEDQVMVLFTLNPSIPYLSKNTKIDFYHNVNRESRYTKLYSLMEYCDYFQMEINYNFSRSITDMFFVLFNKFNFKFIELLLFMLLMVINLIMFAMYKKEYLDKGTQKSTEVVFGLGLANVVLNVIAIIIWLYTKFELYSSIEAKKFCLKHKLGSLTEISKWNRYFVIPIIETILKKNEISGFMWNIIFSSIAISSKQNHYWFALQTLIIINLSKTLKLLISAVLLKYKQLLACVFSLIIVVFFFSSISFFYMSEDYVDTLQTNQENMCGSFFYCFLTNFNFGIRTDGGVARWLTSIKYRDEEDHGSIKHYIGRYFYEVMFFIVLILILLNIIFGIIIDTFAELSEEQHEMEHDMHEKCFICGEGKASLEKKSIDFHKHAQDDHSIWNYVDYLIMLKYVDAQETNAINSYVIEMVNDKKIAWFPAALKSEEDEGEGGHGHGH